MRPQTPTPVYLCGPINGCTDDEATSWRTVATEAFGNLRVIDPMARDYRGRENEAVAEIVVGDKNDIDACGTVLANCWQPSWGTAMEIHYAWNADKPVVSVVRPGALVSPWLRYHSLLIVSALDDAIDFIKYGHVG